MEIFKPIFIVGVPRSGTTLLYDFMAYHKDLAWFSQVDFKEMLSDEFMQFNHLRRRLFEFRLWPFNRDGFEVRITTSFEMPHEAGLFWNKWIPSAWAGKNDVRAESYAALRKTVRDLLIKKYKKRFLSKNPAHSIRIEYLNEVFPGSIFINIIRDGRAVVNSMTLDSRRINNPNPNEYFGLPLKKNNQMDFDLFERHARQWNEVNDEIQRAKNVLTKNQYYELNYEDFTSQPRKSIHQIFKFCELDDYDIFDKGFKRIADVGEIQEISDKLHSANNKYKEELTDKEIQILNDTMKDLLIKFEYT